MRKLPTYRLTPEQRELDRQLRYLMLRRRGRDLVLALLIGVATQQAFLHLGPQQGGGTDPGPTMIRGRHSQ